ncbi:MAG: hypothetical protein PHP82_01400 [Candidatus ainarchaeum sp.]|nr:hypothetical protein [Candidatus ainarchaeum sp.]
MPLKGFVEQTRKTNLLMEKNAMNRNKTDSIIDISDGKEIPREKINEIKNKNNSNNTFFNNKTKINQNLKPITNFEKEYYNKQKEYQNYNQNKTNSNNISKQIIDERHGNIIANVIRESGNDGQKTSWENCKYKKECDGIIYCKEFHSLCGKEKCKRATR